MNRPDIIRVFFGLHLDSLFAYWAYNHVDTVIVTGQLALVIVCTRMLGTEDLLASIAFKGEKVLLSAHLKSTVLTNVAEFHFE